MPKRLLLLIHSTDSRLADGVVEILRSHGRELNWVRVESENDFHCQLEARPDILVLDLPTLSPDIREFLLRAMSGSIPSLVVALTDPASDAAHPGLKNAGSLEMVTRTNLDRLPIALATLADRRSRAELDREDEARREEQYRQIQKQAVIGRLANTIIHDFNNVLTVISGNCEIALEMMPPNDPLREIVADIQAAGQRATLLNRKLLEFCRRQISRPIPVELNLFLTRQRLKLAEFLGITIQLHLELVTNPVWIQVEPIQLEQTLVELVANARNAMPEGGTLRMMTTADSASETICLSITDTGVGMDEITLSRAFEPFFTTRSHQLAAGIGLTTVATFVKQHYGQIEMTTKPGVGTTVNLRFPRHFPGGISGKHSEPDDSDTKGSHRYANSPMETPLPTTLLPKR